MENEEVLSLEKRIDDIQGKFNHYFWLRRIQKDYTGYISFIEREKEYFRVSEIGYLARCDGRSFDLNPHRTIDCRFILEGLKDALEKVNAEIEECSKELEGMV